MVHLGPKPAQHRKGTFADVPAQLLEAIKPFEQEFTISGAKLQEIVNHFISELDRGLSKAGGNIPMIPGWVMDYPTGKETGNYVAIDLGGTNLRVVLVKLGGNRDFDTTQSKFALPPHLRTGSKDELWEFIAKCLKEVVDDVFPEGVTEPIPLGFTFSYPASQDRINEGILQRWTKGWDVPGIEGNDVVPMLQEAVKKVGVPINVVALINDTVGTLVASGYTDPETKMGVIFGTGVNGAYYDVLGDIPKLEGRCDDDIPATSLMAINCEYGSFDNEHQVLPRTKYDIQIDAESPRPGQQSFEKMNSGYYLGELLRLILLELYEKELIFKGQNVDKLKKPFVMDTSFPSRIELDPFENLSDVADIFQDELKIQTTEPERKIIRRLAELIGERSARLSVCGIAAICKKRKYETAHIAADGSVFNKYPGFRERAAKALRDIYEWPAGKEDPIVIVAAEDGSGVGAAIIAALTEKRLKDGKSVGVKANA
ncbi:HXK2 Hexokinase-2 [Candida maltosa Xu316]|uniref:Phosphotransferase n=1 Tax=Candida maltosa (strain Xu316) TaxID=1245528 RepID=M3IQI7_CANMX|nr:Hexokinase [Candida maltosa Xu316]